MQKLVLLAGILLMMGFTPPGKQVPAKTFIPWSADRPVQWSDFRGKAKPNTQEAAMTASSIEFKYETNGVNKMQWKVQSKFFPELSWSKKGKQTPTILKHEQVHFDITEVYARLMRKRFLEEIRGVQDIPKFKSIAKQVMDEWNQEQGTYDKETKHSINSAKQLEWNQAIAERLDELTAYSETSFTLQK